MRNHYQRPRSGPHSVHDARQHAWALLIFGPGAPGPRLRPHPGLLPDVCEAERSPPRRPSLIARLSSWFRRSPADELAEDAGPTGDSDSDRHAGDPAGRPTAEDPDHESRLAA